MPRKLRVSLGTWALALALTAVLGTSAVTGPAWAKPPKKDQSADRAPEGDQKSPGREGRDGAKIIERLARRLDLTDIQEQTLKDFAKSKIRPLMKETMHLRRQSARAALLGAKDAESLHQEFRAKESELYRAQQEMGAKLRGMLSKEQIEKLAKIQERMEEQIDIGEDK